MDAVSDSIRIRSTDGVDLKLMVMRAEGVLTGLAGGEVQRDGVVALRRFLQQ